MRQLEVTVPVGSTATIFLPADSKSIRESGKMLKISAKKGIQSISTTPNDDLKVEVTQGTYRFTALHTSSSE